MLTFLGSFVAAVVLGQAQADRARPGEVVDDQGKPVASARVVFYAPPVVYAQGDAIEAHTVSDAEGKFKPDFPRMKRILVNGIHFLAYQPGLAIAAHAIMRRPYRLVLQKPRPRTVTVSGPDGRPIAGARIVPRLLVVFGTGRVDVPPSLAELLATVTRQDGTATIDYLADRDQLAAVRLTADSIGTQDVVLIERPGRGSEPSVLAITLRPVTHMAGRVVDEAGQPVIGHDVEVWWRAQGGSPVPNTVAFKNGPVRTGIDGSFKTPDNLMKGATYRVAIREAGKDPVLTDWTTLTDTPNELPLLVLRSLRSIRGRVLDRHGQPAAGVAVFQSGDGPELTSTTTDAAGRFSLGGFRQGPVFVFVRGDGFRFQGRLIKPTEHDITVELTRASERPAQPMKMLVDPIPFPESRSLARRLVEPVWASATFEGEDREKYRFLSALAIVDPARVVARLESVRFADPEWKHRLQREFLPALANVDFDEASAVAESIDDPATRAWVLIRLADRVAVGERTRRIELLNRALVHARAAAEPGDRLVRIGQVAERWIELGEVERGKRLFAEGLQVAGQLTDKTDRRRGMFAIALASVDLPAALAIGRELNASEVWAGIAMNVVDRDLAEAERLCKLSTTGGSRINTNPTLAWKLATVDPAAARRVIEGPSGLSLRPFFPLFVALGAKDRHEQAALEAFQRGAKGIDRFLRETPENYQIYAGLFLPIVERIDPALVPEVFWLDVSSRLPGGNPRMLSESSSTVAARLVTRLSFYNREVAAALFEPVRAEIERAGNDPSADWSRVLAAWSRFDPRAAVARIETLAREPNRAKALFPARLEVARSLAQTQEERWREIWESWDTIFGGKRLAY